jgi:hypothetical protein
MNVFVVFNATNVTSNLKRMSIYSKHINWTSKHTKFLSKQISIFILNIN